MFKKRVGGIYLINYSELLYLWPRNLWEFFLLSGISMFCNLYKKDRLCKHVSTKVGCADFV